MEDQLSQLAVTHLLQHTLRSLCIHENSQWVYAVFWRILPRNYPPPKWEGHGAYDRSRGNRRNWILVWEDGFCNFAASSSSPPSSLTEMNSGGDHGPSVYGHLSSSASSPSDHQHHHHHHQFQHQFQAGLQPELFFKMSHEIYNYGEGLIGKVAADHSHKWIYKEPHDQEINFLSAWHNSADSHPRTWEAQFQSGIKTIALIAVREGVVQLGATHKVVEDLSYVVLLRKKFSYIESIPGVLLPHPSSPPYPFNATADRGWHYTPQPHELYDQPLGHFPLNIAPSMSSLEALLSKLPSVVPPQYPGQATMNHHHYHHPHQDQVLFQRTDHRSDEFAAMERAAKDEADGEFCPPEREAGFYHRLDSDLASPSGPAESGF